MRDALEQQTLGSWTCDETGGAVSAFPFPEVNKVILGISVSTHVTSKSIMLLTDTIFFSRVDASLIHGHSAQCISYFSCNCMENANIMRPARWLVPINNLDTFKQKST